MPFGGGQLHQIVQPTPHEYQYSSLRHTKPNRPASATRLLFVGPSEIRITHCGERETLIATRNQATICSQCLLINLLYGSRTLRGSQSILFGFMLRLDGRGRYWNRRHQHCRSIGSRCCWLICSCCRSHYTSASRIADISAYPRT